MIKPIFFKDTELAIKLRNNLVAEKEKLFYLLFFLIILPILGLVEDFFFNQPLISTVELTRFEAFYTFLLETIPYAISFFSFIFCYQLYINNNGKFFTDKIICILFPVFIRVFSLKILLIILAAFFLGILEGAKIIGNVSDSFLMTYAINIIGSIYLFFRLKHNIMIMLKK